MAESVSPVSPPIVGLNYGSLLTPLFTALAATPTLVQYHDPPIGGFHDVAPPVTPPPPSPPIVPVDSLYRPGTGRCPWGALPSWIKYLPKSQIRDWLTLEEEMLRQQSVVVGSVQEIMQVLDKQRADPYGLTWHQLGLLKGEVIPCLYSAKI
ncbi:hypothetical protein AAG570_011440 [Ranatra chinensis]|uniref:Uncharacterized protein n=1 Tax=Ranatra chinensis TaxID=642074 RepID=A0ABD0Z6V8_9HEMI